MKNRSKKLLLVLGLALSTTVNAQWHTEKVDNGLDDPYRICWNQNQYGELLKLENFGGVVALYIKEESYCNDEVSVDVGFLVNGEWKRFSLERGVLFGVMIIQPNLAESTTNFPEFTQYFKACTKMKIRLNYTDCSPEVYEFNMSGSAAALNFIR